MTAIYPPACQGMERGEPSYWDSMVAGRGGIKAGNMYTEGKGSAQSSIRAPGSLVSDMETYNTTRSHCAG